MRIFFSIFFCFLHKVELFDREFNTSQIKRFSFTIYDNGEVEIIDSIKYFICLK